MTSRDHTQSEGLSGAPLFGPLFVDTRVVTPLSTSRASVAADVRAAGLALRFRGEGAPDDADQTSAKAPRPAALPFEFAAVLCGHNPTTTGGAADARHDFRVWDLVQHPTNQGAQQ